MTIEIVEIVRSTVVAINVLPLLCREFLLFLEEEDDDQK
jgi:hypothetical protein